MDDETVFNEGFKPLVKRPSETPSSLSKSFDKQGLVRGMSFNKETGEKESSQSLWESSPYEKHRRSRANTLDRANSFVGLNRANSIDERGRVPAAKSQEAFAIVDPFSTGAHLAAEVCKLGYKCVRVFSIWDSPVAFLVQEGVEVDYIATVQHNDQQSDQEAALAKTARDLMDLPFKILGVLPGAETGVELADQLAERLSLRTNGTEGSFARRNKYAMGEKVRNAGIRAVKQASCRNLEEMHAFRSKLRAELRIPVGESVPVVVKPAQSAGTDDVFLCANSEEAETAFNRILGKINGLGLLNSDVLVQEYLVGTEYVVDKVSRDGLHKLAAIWEYDKRRINDANFVYFGMKMVSADTRKSRVLVEYADKVLNALGIMQGPSHMEVKVRVYTDEKGEEQYDPCLVEVGARCHGGEGTWIPVAMECIGYTVVNLTLDVWLDGKFHASLPKDHYVLKKTGYDVDLCNRHGGIIRGFPGDAALRALPSFRTISWETKIGDYIPKTIDCFTRPGCVQLVNEDREQCERDFEFVHTIEQMGLIDYSIISPNPPSVGAVVVVDPFSSGVAMSAKVLKWGYKLILVFSQKDTSVNNLVAKGSHVKPTLLIQHDHHHPNQDFALEQTMEALSADSTPILAIVAGSETGVELASQLSYKFATRSNGEAVLQPLSSRYDMQECVMRAGLRSVEQKLCSSEAEAVAFLESTSGKLCVVKPNRTDGINSAWVCQSTEHVCTAYGKATTECFDRTGHPNTEVLCQEFIQGREFIVDTVSRDGVHKVVAVWETDKRRDVNGSTVLVPYSMILRDTRDGDVRAAIEYARLVLAAVKINQGPAHMKIVCNTLGNDKYSPVLIDCSARCHSGNGTWVPVVEHCIGYSHIDVALNCYIRPDRFDELPFEPTLLAHGCEVFLVCRQGGIIKDIPGLDLIRDLASFKRMEMLTQPGSVVQLTVDSFTSPGSVQLVSRNVQDLQEDSKIIRSLEVEGMFELV